MTLLADTRPTSTPKLFGYPGVRPGRSVPESLTFESKKLFVARVSSESVVPFSESASPVVPWSPSHATTPTEALTLPLVGVRKPLIGMSTVELAADVVVTSAKPSKTVRLRSGSEEFR